jgi:xylulokinase
MSYLMGIDLGSTSLKAVIYDLAGNVVARSSRPTEKYSPPDHPEWVFWHPQRIWDGVADSISEAVAALSDPRAIQAVAVTGMGLDAVPVDECGLWLYPFISWHDPRTVEQQQWWLEQVGNLPTYAAGGWPVWPNNTALRILWMAQHEPEIHRRTRKWLLIEDFVNFLLCGVQATDYSMASCTLLFDQCTQNWSGPILNRAGIDRRLLCDPRPSGSPLGHVNAPASARTRLPAGTPVILGGHDHLCGALPVGVFKPGLVLDVTGTWEIVTTITATPILTQSMLAAGVVVQSHVAPKTYASWSGGVAAEMLEWYRQQYGSEARRQAAAGAASEWDALMAPAAAAPAGARGVMFLPHMAGASAPVADSRSLGAFVGLSTRTTHGDMLRAIIEGLDYQCLDVLSTMEAEMGLQAKRLVAVGGALRNTFWMQNKADVVGRPIDAPAIEEATPLGAAMLAGIGVGLYRDVQDAYEQVCRPGVTYEPDGRLAAQYAEGFAVYKQLYPTLKPLHHQLAPAPLG